MDSYRLPKAGHDGSSLALPGMIPDFRDADREQTLLDYLAIARKRWLWIVLPTIVVVALVGYYTASQPDRYEATASVLLSDTASQRTLDPGSQNPGFLSREMSNEISLAKSDTVEELVRAELGFLPGVDISSEAEADVLVFLAKAGSAKGAALHANTWADMYVKVKQDEAVRNITAATSSLQERLESLRLQRQDLRSPLDDLDARIDRASDAETATQLQRDYDRLSDDLRYELELVRSQAESAVASLTELELQSELSATGEARIIQVAAPPESTSNTPLSRGIVIGSFLGLLAGIGLALFAEMRDNTIASAADIQAITDLPVLASIPVANKRQRVDLGLATYRDPEGPFADGYHKVRSSLEFVSFENDIRSVLITSPNPSEGKSTTSANLALALSSVGKRTVLVDLDFRRANIHKIFGLEQSPGLSDYILHDAEMRSIAYSIDEPGLDEFLVVPTGSVPPSPAAFVGTGGFLRTIDWLESRADMVVFDAPPLLAVSDAHTLSRNVDAVILTAMAGKTTKGELTEVITALGQVGANLVGVVLLGVEETEGYYGKRYYRLEENDVKVEAASQQNPLINLWDDRGKSKSTKTKSPQTAKPTESVVVESS